MAAQTEVGITTACMAMPAFADVPASGAGVTAVGEARMVPVDSTRVALPWCPGHQAVLVEFRAPKNAGPWECCPRSALRNTLALLRDRFGLTLKAGFELEFLLLERAPAPAGGGQGGLGGSGWRPVDASRYCQSSAADRQARVLDEMVEALEAMGVGVLQWHPESAPGQFEIALQYGDALTAADQLLLAREALAGVAARHGLSVSYLPKPLRDAAGSGCHVHLSLWKDGAPHMVFPGGDAAAAATASSSHSAAADGIHAAATSPSSASDPSAPGPSPALLSFLAGLLSNLEALLPFTAPCPNSYARLQPGAWAGAHAAWGYNNREAPLRATAPGPGRLGEMHLEYKALDGAANPHIALAAIAVAGMLGLSSGATPPEPCQVPPAELAPEAAARLGVRPLPGSLAEALDKLQSAEAFRTALTEAIGAPLLQAYLAVRQAELAHAPNDSLGDMLLRYT